jgi:hypothetical protein
MTRSLVFRSMNCLSRLLFSMPRERRGSFLSLRSSQVNQTLFKHDNGRLLNFYRHLRSVRLSRDRQFHRTHLKRRSLLLGLLLKLPDRTRHRRDGRRADTDPEYGFSRQEAYICWMWRTIQCSCWSSFCLIPHHLSSKPCHIPAAAKPIVRNVHEEWRDVKTGGQNVQVSHYITAS